MSDLISKKAAIDEINDLLKSPYAHSRLGVISEEDAYYIRKEMAGTIIDLCLKSAEIAYDVDKVVGQLYGNGVCVGSKSGFILLQKAVSIVKGGGKDE